MKINKNKILIFLASGLITSYIACGVGLISSTLYVEKFCKAPLGTTRPETLVYKGTSYHDYEEYVPEWSVLRAERPLPFCKDYLAVEDRFPAKDRDAIYGRIGNTGMDDSKVILICYTPSESAKDWWMSYKLGSCP
jgi:hypothetical protein